MSSINLLIRKIDEYANNETIPNDVVGSKIIDDIMLDDDFDLLSVEYPELSEIAECASDMEYESEQYSRRSREKIKELSTVLKSKTS